MFHASGGDVITFDAFTKFMMDVINTEESMDTS